MIRSSGVITATSFLSMFFIGIGITVVGAAARNIGLAPAEIGLIIASQNVGFMISVAVVGALSDRHRKPLLLAIGSVVLALSFFTFYRIDSFWFNVAVMFVIGLGLGTYEGATDAMLIDLHASRANLIINLNHFFVSAGSVAITGYLIYLQMGWRIAVVQTSAVVALVAVIYALIRIDHEHRSGSRLSEVFGFLRRQRIIASLFVAELCALGLGVGTTGILTSFLMEYRAFDQVTSKVALMLFLAGLAIGRIFSGFLARKRMVVGVVPVLFAASVVLFALLYFLPMSPWLIYLVVSLCGLAVAPLLPMQISLAGILFREMAGTAMGVVKVAIAVGGIVVPAIISALAEGVSFAASLAVFPVTAAVGLAAFLFSAKAMVARFPE